MQSKAETEERLIEMVVTDVMLIIMLSLLRLMMWIFDFLYRIGVV